MPSMPRLHMMLLKTTPLAMLVAAAALLISACSDGFFREQDVTQATFTDHYESVDRLVVEHEFGSIDIGAGAELIVERTHSSTPRREPDERIAQVGAELHVGAECPASLGRGTCRVDYRITVPDHVDVVVLAQANNVTVNDVASDVQVTSDSGNITISHAQSAVHAETMSGNVTLDIDQPTSVDASSDSGNQRLTFGAVPDRLSTSSRSGNVRIAVPADSGPYAVTTSTTSGNVEIAPEFPQQADGSPIDIVTDSGNIEVDVR